MAISPEGFSATTGDLDLQTKHGRFRVFGSDISVVLLVAHLVAILPRGPEVTRQLLVVSLGEPR